MVMILGIIINFNFEFCVITNFEFKNLLIQVFFIEKNMLSAGFLILLRHFILTLIRNIKVISHF